jgi:tetratricopeptide (TPR) repeat protein
VITKQKYLIIAAIGSLLLLLFLAKTINPNKKETQPIANSAQISEVETLSFSQILSKAKQGLKPYQISYLAVLEAQVNREETSAKIHTFHRLANFWKDSVHLFEPYGFYTSEAAKLENSEKSLTFAAQQFIDNLLVVNEPSLQNWFATTAKVLLDKALLINPANDSSKIGLGACYILGNISNNPMQGILPVREIAAKNANNIYAQTILGLGGKKSGQYDKAIERFLVVAKLEPSNIEAIINLAECFELKKDNTNAKIWYKNAKGIIKNEEIKKEIEKRINDLK